MGVMLFPYQMLLISFTKYEFTNKEIIIHQAFSKNVIPIETIRNTAKKESRFLKKVLVAAPKETTTIQYNKYDSAELFLSEKQIQSLLQ